MHSKTDRDQIMATAFAKIDADLRYLVDRLAEVLVQAGDGDLVAYLPWRGGDLPEGLPGSDADDRICQLLSVCFQLLNAVEENAAMQARRAREGEAGYLAEQGLWGRRFARRLEDGCSPDEILAKVRTSRVEPVFTAHPTEAKRHDILHLHRELYLHLVSRENRMWTATEQRDLDDDIRSVLERLWRTGEVHFTRPTVAQERDGIIHYLGDVLPEVIPLVDKRFRHAWHEAGMDPKLVSEVDALPQFGFGSWVGGDRDGHPGVTAETTRATLHALRRGALDTIHRALTGLADQLGLSSRLQAAPPRLLEGLAGLAAELATTTDDPAALEQPWRTFALRLARRVDADRTALDAGAFGSLTSTDLDGWLRLLDKSLREIGATTLARTCVGPVQRLLQVFGLHLAALDVRQNSAFHDRAFAQILVARGEADGANWPQWDEDRRLALLATCLADDCRWEAPARQRIGDEANAVLDCYRVLSAYIRRAGPAAVGSLIVSMTRSLSDLLLVHALARIAGLETIVLDGPCCPLPVVPLFETIDDLAAAPGIMDRYLANPLVQRGIQARRSGEDDRARQQVMLGYSDSNKDGGFLASQWFLHQAQKELVAVANAHTTDLVFFHGRGGTVSRGAGPTDRFLEALPHGSLCGHLRLTEQGETIAQKYANPGTATYNLELLSAGAASISLVHSGDEPPKLKPLAAMQELVASSRSAYESLLAADGFIEFWAAATPVDLLEQARIGSRPARRTGRRSLEDLRAIPWVFSWNQSRFYLPGWYGLGTALETLRDNDPEGFQALAEALPKWPFWRYCIYNAETSHASADTELMTCYAGLVEDPALRDTFLTRILAEYDRTATMFEALTGADRNTRRPRMTTTLAMRDAPLRMLHREQVALIRRWRQARSSADERSAEAMLPTLLQSLNAIAAGLRTTG